MAFINLTARLAAGALALLTSGPTLAGPIAESVHDRLAQAGSVRVLVMLADSDDAAATTETIAAQVDALLDTLPADDTRLERRFATVPAVALTVGTDALAKLASSRLTGRIDLDEGGTGGLIESQPLALTNAVASMGYSGAGSKIAIIDSGVRLDHQSFTGRIASEACFCTGCCPNGGNTQFGPGSGAHSHAHGTNVAGIAAGGAGVAGVPAGVAPSARIVSIRVLDNNNSFCCASDIIAAMDWLRVNHPDTTIANLSLGTSTRFPGHCDNATAFTQAMSTAVNGLRGQGTLVSVSSGNNGSSVDMQAPACVENALSVAAVWDANLGAQSYLGCAEANTAPDQVTCFSNLSTTTDLLAPGAYLTAAGIASPSSSITFGGTSMAAPMAAGCAALLHEAFGPLPPATIQAALTASPTRLSRPTPAQAYPRLDCLDAFHYLDRIFANGFQ